ncbi:unnamed protein product [Acanthoscelides obtectus]|uniref:RB1-inducible coiled-coil protein 1 n=1 Tax=Acanthoscelides obtectus TaxID=200917 RepID=A0A9P0P014_ACAOB|nr:unnamed protein product [Acanthoscelides obtectus]CAK1629709.1 RB1-inducible coiled-coil protein 1 [Acanthoscelides obtectus]
MLFVFYVDAGRMMTFDMNLALHSVLELKKHMQQECQVPPEKQVLLISGGECLDNKKRVCSYSAGTDTNPIFLFSRKLLESPTPPGPNDDQIIDPELDKRIRDHLDMPIALHTVVKRTQLAQRLHEQDEQLLRNCEKLVHEQHLQQQGWSAVVANLEDLTVEFRRRSETFDMCFSDFMSGREAYYSFLQYFHSDLEVLQRIPVLSVLVELDKQNRRNLEKAKKSAEKEQAEESKTSLDESKTSLEVEKLTVDEPTTNKDVSLFDWISTADDKNTLDQLYEHCTKGLETFNGRAINTLKSEIRACLLETDNNKMKEVKGLGERLFGLENLIVKIKMLVKSQSELAQSFVNNQSRASNTKDPSVLPDLCMSHKQQLQMMGQHHREIVDIRRRIIAAKDELSLNLYHRLRWVMYLEEKIVETDHRLVMYYENLKRLRHHLQVLQQVHLAPVTYLNAVAEVVRRRAFSQSFLLWASEVACHMLTIHNEEMTRRKDFQAQFEGHFLSALFPGMDDLPPSFATQPPSIFDSALPTITQEDIERLKKEVPDLADNLIIPDTSAITNFLLRSVAAMAGTSVRRSIEGNQDVAVEDKPDRTVYEAGLGKYLLKDAPGGSQSSLGTAEEATGGAPIVPPLKDLEKGCESETDTEEFEKVGQSPLELNFDKQLPSPQTATAAGTTTAPRPGPPHHQDAATLTEDNLQISRSEHEKLKSGLLKMQSLAKEAVGHLKNQLADLKNNMTSDIVIVNEDFFNTGTGFKHKILEYECRTNEIFENFKKEQTAITQELKSREESNLKEISELKEANESLRRQIEDSDKSISELRQGMEEMKEKSEAKIRELEKHLSEKDKEKEKAVKEVSDRFIREHKAEVENIRCRFKLMTMERAPSESSLEKSGDYSSLSSQTTLLAQMAENFELDKEKAVNQALKEEREKWEKVLAARIKDMERHFEEDKDLMLQEVARRVSDEKDRQIDVLRDRERDLILECSKHKSTIQQLTECNVESCETELLEMLNALQSDKDRLEEELQRLKLEMTGSVSVCEGILHED